MAFIHVLQRYMSTRSPLTLRAPLIAWNAALALFRCEKGISVGAKKLVYLAFWEQCVWAKKCCINCVMSHFGVQFVTLSNRTLLPDIGTSSGILMPTHCEFRSSWFALSKPIELLDTLFLILRKRPVIFLHWYHHVTVLLYTWLSGERFLNQGRK